MHLILNPGEASLRDSMIAFFHDLGFHRDAIRLGNKAFDDYRDQRAKRLKRALSDQATVAKQNANAKHHSVEGIGQVMRRMAPTLRAELTPLYGHDFIHDDKFMDRLDKDNNFNFKPSYEGKTTIVKQ